MALFRYTRRTYARELLLLGLAAVWWIPFYLLVVISLKPTGELFTTNPAAPPKHPTLSNFGTAWNGTGGYTLGQALKSSAIITIGSVVALIVIGSLCAYAIGRRPGRLGTALYLAFVVGIIVPFQLGIVPLYVVLRHLNINATYLGMILLNTGLFMPLTVFLYTGFVRALPRDYEEAAYVDGASRVYAFVRVVFPLLRPITTTIAVLTTVYIWNDFFTQLIFLAGSPLQTVPVEIYSFVGEYATNWSYVFATVLLSLAPILLFYFVAQRQLIRGFSGGIKA